LSNNKKIFYIWKSAYPWDVRIEKICSALVEFGYETYIICLWDGEDKQEENINGINILRVGFNQNKRNYLPIPYNPNWKKSIEQYIKSIKPDLIINREIILADISGKLAKKYEIPIIMDMAENYPAAMKLWKKYSDSLVKKLIYHQIDMPKWLEKKSLELMDGVIVVCDENGERIRNEYNYENYIETIYNTPSLNFFNFKKFEQERDYITISYHGYINTERNLDKVLSVGSKFNNLKFDIWGDGVLLEELKSKFAKFDNITFYGAYKLENLNNIIQSTDIGILPYSLNDHIHNTLSNKMFDYMACGIPVLTSQAKSMVNFIDKYDIGYYFDFEDENNIEKTFSKLNSLDWAAKAKNGLKAFQSEFNWENDKTKLREFLERFI
jgi:glycosyltransferase involved in cell wall biosynthesis